MATQVQIRRDSATNLASSTPVIGEAGYDTTNKNLIVGDGARVGGIPHLSYKHDQTQRFRFASGVGGTADAITITLNEALDAYTQGVAIEFVAASSNTGITTINVSSLGTKTLKKIGSSGLEDLDSDDIKAGCIYRVVYDGTYFQIGGYAQPTDRVLLKTISLASDSAVSILSSDLGSYERYVIEGFKVKPSTDGADLRMRCSVDGGATFSTATAYVTSLIGKVGTVAQTDYDLTSSYLLLTGTSGVGNATNEKGVDFNIEVKNLSSTGVKIFKVETFFTNTSENPCNTYGRLNLTASPFLASGCNGLQFYFSSGNLASGTIKLYGYTS